MRFTAEQQAAIDTRGTSLLLSAAAGSGKTTVLVERVMQMIQDKKHPVDIDKILVVTFTKAAAAGMKEKLHRELKSQAQKHPDDRNLKKQLLALQNASITTVHSFCSDVMKNYLHLLGDAVPSGYRLLSENEAKLLKYRAMEQVLEAFYETEDPVFEQVVEAYSSHKNDDKLQEILLDIYDFIISMPYYREWFDNCLSHFAEAINKEDNLYMQLICAHTVHLLESFLSAYAHIIPEEKEATAALMKNESSIMREALLAARENGFFRLAKLIQSLSFEKVRRNSYREFVKKQIGILQDEFFCQDKEQIASDAKKTLPLIQKISQLVLKFDEIFRTLKREQNAIDFNDLEHFAIQILSCRKDGKIVPTEATLAYREKFAEIMVDEYQDTNDVQEQIFRMVSREERNLFVVGDVKQSIYSFRQANPEIFLRRSGKNEKRDWAKTIYLSQNFRCRKNIVDFTNFVFDDIMEEKLSAIPYAKTERLVEGAAYSTPEKSELYNVEVLLCHKENDEESQIQNGESEGILIADRIRSLMNDPQFLVEDNGEKRRLRYRDISILVRGISENTKLMVQTLENYHIPVNFSEKKPLLEAPEVKGLFAFLEVLDNPYHDIAMIAVLKQFFRKTNRSLLELRLRDKKKHFYELMLAGGYEAELNLLEKYRRLSFQVPVYELLQAVLRETHYLALQSACPDGLESRENLLCFLEMAKDFEATEFRGLYSFVSYIRELMNSPVQDGHEIPADANRDAVQLMTIHRSKGLEFPVVILAHAGKQINTADLNKVLQFHRDYGIGFDCVNLQERYRYPTLMKNAIRLKVKQEQTAEELRLLYVALTRAREKLIITGNVRFMESGIRSWNHAVENPTGRIGYDGLFAATSYLSFLMPPLLRLEPLKDINRSGLNISSAPFGVIFQDYTYSQLEHLALAIRNEEQELLEVLTDASATLSLDALCDISYPFRKKELPRKISVSEIRRLQTEDHSNNILPVTRYTPIFAQEDRPMNSADYGTMVHRIFEWIDIKQLQEGKDIDELISLTAVQNSKIVLEEKVRKGVRAFFESELGRALLHSEKICREQDFLIRLPADELFPDAGRTDSVMVQGIIDCYFYRDETHVVLVDYKNSAKPEALLKQDYAPQIALYRKALQKILGDGIFIESYLWDVNRGKSIPMDE